MTGLQLPFDCHRLQKTSQAQQRCAVQLPCCHTTARVPPIWLLCAHAKSHKLHAASPVLLLAQKLRLHLADDVINLRYTTQCEEH